MYSTHGNSERTISTETQKQKKNKKRISRTVRYDDVKSTVSRLLFERNTTNERVHRRTAIFICFDCSSLLLDSTANRCECMCARRALCAYTSKCVYKITPTLIEQHTARAFFCFILLAALYATK